MTEINSLDLKEFINNAVLDVFDTMLSMEVQPVSSNQSENNQGTHIVGSVSFAGAVMGNVNMRVNMEFASQMTAAMLGMEVDEIEGTEEVHDVIGEVCNMIGGDLKSRLCDANLNCELSIPSITTGKEFKIESRGWDRNECYTFRNHQHFAVVEVYIKAGK